MFNTAAPTGKQKEALDAGCKFAIDNGVFSGKWNERDWLMKLIDFLPYRDNCLFAIAPDQVGDWHTTIDRFHLYHAVIRRLGFPVAIATQDGAAVDKIPWSLIDVVFVGGTNYHKRGLEAEQIAMEAKQKKKWVHVGRVSSVWAIKQYWSWADSFDGTTFVFEPDKRFLEYTPQFRRLFNETTHIHQKKLL